MNTATYTGPIRPLTGEKCITQNTDDGKVVKVQFSNTKLPKQFTHNWVTVRRKDLKFHRSQ